MARNTSIKIRLTEEEKMQLKKRATSSKSMSAYILKQSLYSNSNQQTAIIQTMETLDILNTIILQIEKCENEPLKRQIKQIIAERMQK